MKSSFERLCIICGEETLFSKILGKVEASFCAVHFPYEAQKRILCYV